MSPARAGIPDYRGTLRQTAALRFVQSSHVTFVTLVNFVALSQGLL
jgi:hypothetical protein